MKRISIKSIVLGIIAIAITITIGISIAKADTARVGREKGHDLGMHSALHKADLRAGLDARLKAGGLLKVAALGRLNSKDLKLNSLDRLNGCLLS